MYTSIGASHTQPCMLPELMAYISHIIGVHHDYSGLAWIRYDTAFRCQVALTANHQWSRINTTLYSVCFIGAAWANTRCEICLATSHSTTDCAQQINPDSGVLDRVRALESMILLTSIKLFSSHYPVENRQTLVELCCLWNCNSCSYPRCRYLHACLLCKGNHPAVTCPKRNKQLPAKKLPASGM